MWSKASRVPVSIGVQGEKVRAIILGWDAVEAVLELSPPG